MILIQEFLMLEPQMTACEILLYLNTYYYPCEEPSVSVVTPPDYVDIEDDWQDAGGNDTLPEEDFEIEPTDPIWWYHTDHLGSSTYLTNVFGRPSHYYETLPFGEMMVEHNQSLYTAGQYNNAFKFNGKELDEFTQMYYYGARYYDPRFSIFVSVDPLSESTMEPYSYVGNNPIMFTDPTGMAAVPPTDFVDINSGKITTINDGIDQTIALDGGAIDNMQNLFNTDCDAYNQQLGEYGKSSSNLGLSNSDFMFFAETLYAESSGGFKESLGIVNVLENRASNQGNSVMDQLSDKSPYGVYGVRKTSSGINSDYKYSYMNEMGKPGTEQKRNNVHRAIAVGLSTSADISNGGMFWDGKDFNGKNKINGGYRARYSPGFLFSSPSHDLWKQGSNKVNGTYKHISTGAVGNTTFSKFYNQGSKWYTIK